MTNSTQPNISELKRAIAIAEQIEKLKAEVSALLGGMSAADPKTPGLRGRPKGSKQTVKSSAAAPAAKKTRKTRVLTPAGRARLSAALKARWAARKKGAPALNAAKK